MFGMLQPHQFLTITLEICHSWNTYWRFVRYGEVSAYTKTIALQRYLMKYLMKVPFPVREIGAVMALLHVSHQLQDLLRLKDFERQHDFQ